MINNIIPIILAGGTGSRLWPLSRESFPKQYLCLGSDDNQTLLQKTQLRILDFKNITPSDFNISNFIDYCALHGKIKLGGIYHTLLLSPMKGFYNDKSIGKKQARIALVEPESKMEIVPKVLSLLLKNYLKSVKP